MLSTIFPIVSSFSSTTERPSKGRSFQNIYQTFLPIVISSRKAALKGRLFPERDYFCAGNAIYAYFCAFGKVARIFPLHLSVCWSGAAFGAAPQR
jgi:hypothetical protein